MPFRSYYCILFIIISFRPVVPTKVLRPNSSYTFEAGEVTLPKYSQYVYIILPLYTYNLFFSRLNTFIIYTLLTMEASVL